MDEFFRFMSYWLFHIGLNLLKFFNIVKITVFNNCNYLYNNVDFVKTNVDSIMRFFYDIKKKIVKHRVELFDDTWTGLTYIKNGVYEENNYVIPEYNSLNNPSEMSQLTSNFNGSYNFAKHTLSKEIPEYLVLLKSPHFWLSRICNDKINDYDISLITTPKYFLSIEYSHPCMENKINIEIDPLFYLDQNELFSSIFVLRCLEYQPLPYVFDSDYKLHIMDNEIKMFDLTSDEYIKLNKSGYTIIKKDNTRDNVDTTDNTTDNTILYKLNRAFEKILNIDDEDDYEIFEDELMK